MPLTAPPAAAELPKGVLGSAVPEEILYEAEEPVVFTLRTALGQRVLAYLADASATTRWLLLTPCGDALLTDLKRGRVPVREALEQSWVWLATLDNRDEWSDAWAIELGDIPPDHLPQPGVMLLPEHQPVLSTRAVGPSIGRATTPASVVAFVADRTRRALKSLLEFELDLASQGRPSEDLRALYDLPVQRISYASFEVSFSAPERLFDDPALERSVALLRRGLRWAAAEDGAPLSASDDAQRSAVLRALKLLTPPTTGAIQRIDIGGRWMRNRPAILQRDSSRRVQTELRRTTSERVAQAEGRLREFDKDNLTFTLRDTPDGNPVRGAFDEELYDELFDYFANDDRVTVAGVVRGGKLYVAAVSAAETMPPPQEPDNLRG